jgi:hypothetical protein
LANFFNSLLHKKSGTQSGPNSLTPRPSNGTESLLTPDKMIRTAAESELDRLARNVVKKDLDFTTQSDC